MNNIFQNLAETAQCIAETRGTNAKITICANYFRSLDSDENLNLASQYLGEGAFSALSGKRASVGSRTWSTCAAEFCEIDYEKVFKPCRTALGSSSEAIEKLMRNLDRAREKRSPARMSLSQINRIYENLYRASSRQDKQNILHDAWTRMMPVEIKYFIRIMSGGSLRIGFDTQSVTSSIAVAFDQPLEDVRFVHMITGSIGRTAILSKKDELDSARFNMFQPISFMLASPVESRSVESLEQYVGEEKFDGMRSQLHIRDQQVELFSRDLNNITRSFPEIPQFFLSRNTPGMVLDGEICVYRDKAIQPFQLLQKRMGRKKPGKRVLDRYPVLFIAFDLLYHNGRAVFEDTLIERRRLLEELAEKYRFPIANQFEVRDLEQVEQLFERAVARGNEGLVLKKKESRYEYGQRRKSWLKVKEPAGSLDTVIMYAHAGSGKRGGYYSDFTLGINVRDDERYEEEFIPIGRAYGGYTDREMKRLNKRIRELTVETYGPTRGLVPKIVVELEFDGIQVNKRTKANYTLRLPRFKAIRWDLDPSHTDTLRDVERLYREAIERDRLKQGRNPSFLFNKKKSETSDQRAD